MDSTNTGYTGAETKDELQHLINLHREGKHSGRQRDPNCPHCNDTAHTIRRRDTHQIPFDLDRAVRDSAFGEAEKKPPLSQPVEARRADHGPNAALFTWWRDQADREIEQMQPQIRDYGSVDLEIMGRILGDAMFGSADLNPAEVGCGFYLLGKISRAVSAYREGREPSRDTIVDIAFYARMILRIRDCGSWPGPVGSPGDLG